MIVNTKEMLLKADSSNYAIPSPDFINVNQIKAYIEVAEELKVPALIATGETLEDIFPMEEAYYIASYYAKRASVPVALHIDHGQTIDYVKRAIDIGYTSVMIDASSDDFETNVRKTKEIVEYAHKKDVTVEAEIGHVGSGLSYESGEGDVDRYTEVDELVKFIELTNVDSVAVSIGTAHGEYKGVPKINFERLKELKAVSKVPLVLHGGSSTGDDNLRKCAELGISKINIFTDISIAGAKAIKKIDKDNYVDMILASDKAMKDMLRHYYKVFNM